MMLGSTCSCIIVLLLSYLMSFLAFFAFSYILSIDQSGKVALWGKVSFIVLQCSCLSY